MTSIYALADPTTRQVRYVGKTKVSVEARLRGHITDSARHQYLPRFKWINGLLLHGLRPEICELENVGGDDWREAERFWIAYLRFLGCDLLNATAGGDGIDGFRHAEETKARQSGAAVRRYMRAGEREKTGESVRLAYISDEKRARLGAAIRKALARPESIARRSAIAKAFCARPEVRAARSAALTGRVFSEAHKAKISAAMRGKKRSPEAVEKTASAHRGMRRSAETRAKIACGARRRYGAAE